jgi:acyl carrier protein
MESEKVDPRSLSDLELTERVRSFVADAADFRQKEIATDASLFADIGMDSLGFVAVFIDVAYVFGIPEPASEEEYKTLDSVEKIVRFIRQRQEGGANGPGATA